MIRTQAGKGETYGNLPSKLHRGREGDMKQGSREGAVPLCPTRTCLPLVPTFRRARVTLGFDFHGPGPKAKRDER